MTTQPLAETVEVFVVILKFTSQHILSYNQCILLYKNINRWEKHPVPQIFNCLQSPLGTASVKTGVKSKYLTPYSIAL